MSKGKEAFEDVNKVIATFYPVRDYQIAQNIIDAPDAGDDNRSPWQWFTLANGDLIFGCFPQGELFCALEKPVSEDYVMARRLGEVHHIEAPEDDQ